jgi:hypothetical protein
MWKRQHLLLNDEPGAAGGGGGAAAPAADPAASAAPPAPAASAPAAPAPSAAPAAAPAAGKGSAAAPATPEPTPAPTATPTWPENWRETVSKEDAKRLAQLQRYASPEAAIQALFAAQDRIRSGELKPVLGKNPSADEIKEWRAAHGIPESHDKYDLGKDVAIDESDKPMFDVFFKAAHEANQTPEQVRAIVKSWNDIKRQTFDAMAEADRKHATESEDALRSEWGPEFRRNVNLIHGLLDFSGAQSLKESLLGARLPNGRVIGSDPDAMRMLLGVALAQNPTGVVVPGGGGENGEGIKGELEKLQKIPANKKTAEQSERERGLIDAAVKAGFMDENGKWKRA